VGGVIGGLALLLVITGAIFFWRRRTQQAKITLGPAHNDYSVLRPFGTQVISVSQINHYPNETLINVGMLHFKACLGISVKFGTRIFNGKHEPSRTCTCTVSK
jgi:hypothetical protein